VKLQIPWNLEAWQEHIQTNVTSYRQFLIMQP